MFSLDHRDWSLRELELERLRPLVNKLQHINLMQIIFTNDTVAKFTLQIRLALTLG